MSFIKISLIFAVLIFIMTACDKPRQKKTIDIRTLSQTTETTVVDGSGYFPVILRLPDDEVQIVLRGGARHMGIGGRLDLVRSLDGGKTWSAPKIVVDSERDDRNPAFGVAPNGTLVLGYHWQGGYDPDGTWNPAPEKQDTKITLSHDRGKTWETPFFVNLEIQRGNSPFGKIFSDAAGTMYMPIYGAKNPKPGVRIKADTTHTFLLVSKDNGETWNEAIEVAQGLNEAAYLILPNGDWLCAARSQKRDEQAIYVCRSGDQGQNWTEPVRVTAAREHPPDLVQLKDGTILCIFGVRHEPFGIQGIVSRDGGRTWLESRLMFRDDLPGTDIGYPSTVRLSNGRLITAFYQTGYKKNPEEEFRPACLAICYDEQELLEALEECR